MKKVVSILLAAIMLISCGITAFAADYSLPVLSFDDNGDFKILHLCDCQDNFPAHKAMLDFIVHALDKYDPDLVVLGGDNTVGEGKTKSEAIAELVKPFVDSETYFTLVFGNHDREQGVTNEELLRLYQQHGGKYCLAYNADNGINGVGNHNLPIFSSNPLVPAYNLYMFDSGTSGFKDDAGHDGYEGVHDDQIRWFESVNSTYTLLNGGTEIPSMVFQHIIVGEIMDVLYKEKSEVPLSLDSKFCHGKDFDLTFCDLSAIKSGIILEPPCPAVKDNDQFEAMVRQKVVATFSGHDHINTFTVEHMGVDIVNTPGATYESYGNDLVRGGRLITIHDDTREYESEVITISQEVMDGADIEYSTFNSFFGVTLHKIVYFFFNLFK